jgi:hypothetical protein
MLGGHVIVAADIRAVLEAIKHHHYTDMPVTVSLTLVLKDV